MIKHTLQEWCDWLGVYAVKNNLRETGTRPSFFTPNDITLYLNRPELVLQKHGKACYVDTDPGAWFGNTDTTNLGQIITEKLYFLVSDLESIPDFRLYEPTAEGTDKPSEPPAKERQVQTRTATRRSFERERAMMWSQDAVNSDKRTLHGR